MRRFRATQGHERATALTNSQQNYRGETLTSTMEGSVQNRWF